MDALGQEVQALQALVEAKFEADLVEVALESIHDQVEVRLENLAEAYLHVVLAVEVRVDQAPYGQVVRLQMP